MKILKIDLNSDYTEAISEAKEVLSRSGVIVYPTDTLYGLGANAMDVVAVERIFEIKGRDFSKPLPVLVKNMKWVKEIAYIGRWEETLEKVWPGKVTAILEKKDLMPNKLTAGEKTIGIRIADHALTDKLLGRFGYPITSTSANISGQESPSSAEEIAAIFRDRENKPDLILDVGVLPKSEPSVVVDFTTTKPKILRVGPSKPEQLMKILEL
jgi:L-threonylcarbamoyladenylate synthase